MSILSIVTLADNNPILRQRTKEVVDFADPALATFIEDMTETMYAKDGIGLAAPQIDSTRRIAVIVPDPTQFEKYKRAAHKEALVIINPEITHHSLFRESGEEGCLSIPGIFGEVSRWKEVTVSYQDSKGKPQVIQAKGLMARVLQHEIDHLNGTLFIDHTDKLYQAADDEGEHVRVTKSSSK